MEFKNYNPKRVSKLALKECDLELRESLLKRTIRIIISKIIQFIYGIDTMGTGFQWGRWLRWSIPRNSIKIGHYVFLAPGLTIRHKTVIGDLCMVAKNVHFVGNDHGYHEIGKPIRITKPPTHPSEIVTIVESEVWIGQRSTIFAGVKIGHGSIIAAGSVVTSDIEPYSIVGGVPSKLIKMRFTEEEIINHNKKLYD